MPSSEFRGAAETCRVNLGRAAGFVGDSGRLATRARTSIGNVVVGGGGGADA